MVIEIVKEEDMTKHSLIKRLRLRYLAWRWKRKYRSEKLTILDVIR